MVLDGLKGLQAKKTKSMTFNYKSVLSYLVLAQLGEEREIDREREREREREFKC